MRRESVGCAFAGGDAAGRVFVAARDERIKYFQLVIERKKFWYSLCEYINKEHNLPRSQRLALSL